MNTALDLGVLHQSLPDVLKVFHLHMMLEKGFKSHQILARRSLYSEVPGTPVQGAQKVLALQSIIVF